MQDSEKKKETLSKEAAQIYSYIQGSYYALETARTDEDSDHISEKWFYQAASTRLALSRSKLAGVVALNTSHKHLEGGLTFTVPTVTGEIDKLEAWDPWQTYLNKTVALTASLESLEELKKTNYEKTIDQLKNELDSLKSELLMEKARSLTLPIEEKEYEYDIYFSGFLFKPLRDFLANFHYFSIEKHPITPSSAALKLTNRFISSLIIGIKSILLGKSSCFHFPELFTIKREGSKLEIIPDKNLQSHLKKFERSKDE